MSKVKHVLRSNGIIPSENFQEDNDVIQSSQVVTGTTFHDQQKSVENTIRTERPEVADTPVNQQVISSNPEVTVTSPNV